MSYLQGLLSGDGGKPPGWTADDERQADLTAEEVAELVRARKARAKWGGVLFVVAFAAGLASAFWLRDLAMTTVFLGVACVGAGFADPSEIKGLWK